MYRQPPTEIFGQKITEVFHQGDVAKLEVLREHGGIYLDYDVIVVNSFNPLRRYPATYGEKC
jgi:mannosyltransferase OCH1-like enzyme